MVREQLAGTHDIIEVIKERWCRHGSRTACRKTKILP